MCGTESALRKRGDVSKVTPLVEQALDADVRVITSAELALHNKPGDAWVAIRSKVSGNTHGLSLPPGQGKPRPGMRERPQACHICQPHLNSNALKEHAWTVTHPRSTPEQ